MSYFKQGGADILTEPGPGRVFAFVYGAHLSPALRERGGIQSRHTVPGKVTNFKLVFQHVGGVEFEFVHKHKRQPAHGCTCLLYACCTTQLCHMLTPSANQSDGSSPCVLPRTAVYVFSRSCRYCQMLVMVMVVRVSIRLSQLQVSARECVKTGLTLGMPLA